MDERHLYPVVRYDETTRTWKCKHLGLHLERDTAQEIVDILTLWLTFRIECQRLKLDGEELDAIRRAA